MYIPNLPVAPDSYLPSLLSYLVREGETQFGDDAQRQRWSSLIGIVTAIVGNLLISFALNTQRYAHILIARQRSRAKRRYANGGGPPRNHTGYGSATHGDTAAGRERKNLSRSQSNADGADHITGPSTEGSLQIPSDAQNHNHGHEKESNEDQDRPSYLKSPYWWLGLVLMVIGEAGNFLAYGFAPAHIVSPLGVVALVSNCLIAPMMLHEQFRKRDFWGVLIAVAGAVTVVLSAQTSEEKLGPGELWATIRRWEFLLYVIITLLLIGVLMYVEPRYGRRTILLDLGLVALFGGYTALSTKGVASLLSASLWKAFTYPITYFLAIILIGSALMQIRYLNRALQNYDSTQVIPTQFVLFTLSVIIGSAVLYRDFEHTTAAQAGKFILGCLLTFFGVYLITSGRDDHDEEFDEQGDEEEETIRLLDEEAEGSGEQTLSQRDRERSVKSGSADMLPPTSEQDEADDLLTPRRPSEASSRVPSIAVTPAESTSAPDANPWSSDDQYMDAPLPPRSAQLDQLLSNSASTAFFTPQSSNPVDRIRSMPAGFDLEISNNQDTPRLPSPILRPTTSRPEEPSPVPNFLARSARGSISRLLPVPGPLLSPLSSSLSALVADSLLKGEGASPAVRAANRRTRSAHHVAQQRRRSVALGDEENPLAPGFGDHHADGTLRRTFTQETMLSPSAGYEDDGDQQFGQNRSMRRPKLRALSETISGMMGWPRENTTGKRRDDMGHLG
ncbi:hypothetical protein A1O1_08675 [Capronia coronata CBS 617.96]|uniref:Magnesium transporter NIPA n=1 Tax=Capronia coronata CBS 617.96 TaxID=1182541 RepID=W9YDY9_9EURO|nr:uncharacterized protein A1O1_08675 [Capronia coronata CBS 617.96]EXJ80529.1 hypothetical protein A1O1_08675 [Capronia coronata CBS 617.96]